MHIENKNLVWRWSAIAVLSLAAILRACALTWGLPNQLHGYSYHPDEFLTVGAAFNVFSNSTLNTHFYNYPTLYPYLCSFFQGIASASGFATDFGLYLACRIVTVLMGTGTVAVVMFGISGLYGRKAGLISGLFIALSAIHVQHSHFATVDVPSTLLVAASLVSSLLFMKKGAVKWIIWAGVFAGLAAGTKYNAGLVVFAAIVAPFLCEQKLPLVKRAGLAVFASIYTVAAFIISTPAILLYSSEFMHGIDYELKHSSEGHGLVFAGTGPGILYAFHNLAWAVGIPMLILLIASVVYAVVNKRRDSLVILAFVIPYFVLMLMSQVRFVRYEIPLLPGFAIICGIAASSIFDLEKKWIKGIGSITALILLSGFIYSLSLITLFCNSDTRDEALQAVRGEMSATDAVGFLDTPWFYSPPLTKMLGYGTTVTRQKAVDESGGLISIIKDHQHGTPYPRFFIISDYETGDALRLKGRNDLTQAQTDERDTILKSLDEVNINYDLKESFRKSFLGIDASRLPHDMRYQSPQIDIYERRQ